MLKWLNKTKKIMYHVIYLMQFTSHVAIDLTLTDKRTLYQIESVMVSVIVLFRLNNLQLKRKYVCKKVGT